MSWFNGFWEIYFEAIRISKESQQQRFEALQREEQRKRWEEMEQRITDLERTLHATIEQSRQHRQEFRQRQQRRQTAAIAKKLISKIIDN